MAQLRREVNGPSLALFRAAEGRSLHRKLANQGRDSACGHKETVDDHQSARSLTATPQHRYRASICNRQPEHPSALDQLGKLT